MERVANAVGFVRQHAFVLALATYFVVVAGFVYDIIMEPPGIGQELDANGIAHTRLIARGHGNAQYVVEGVFASFLFVAAAAGFVAMEHV